MKKVLKRDGSDEPFVTIVMEKELIYVDWNGFLNVDLVKRGSEELLKVIKDTQAKKALIDNRKVSGPWQAANQWYQEDWNPRAAKAGLKEMAIIQSDNVFSQLSLQGFTKATQGAYLVAMFNSEPNARQWLSEDKETVAN